MECVSVCVLICVCVNMHQCVIQCVLVCASVYLCASVCTGVSVYPKNHTERLENTPKVRNPKETMINLLTASLTCRLSY